MASSERDNRERLQELLRELFQFDTADLDFGVYRILNQRRDEIEAFIEEDLLDTVEESLESVADAKREEIEAELERKRTALNQEWDDDIFNADGSLKEQYASLGQSAIDEYQELQEARENAAVAEETEARIFSDLYRFFSRYYDDGDFHTKRRISARDAKYAVPYNGEETHFHWANHDQYYVKTGEHFTDYRFDAEPYTVEFRLEEADVPQDNVKGDSRYFVLGRGDPIAADADEHRVTIRFQYRRITDTEADEYVEDYNDATGDDRSSFAHMTPEMRCDALQGRILAAVENGEIERALTATGDEDDTPTELKKHLTRYVTENSMDYFVHKDLETFLERELEFFLQNEVLDVDDLLATEDGESPALVRARTVKQIAERIITFLAQIEDFQKRLFEKKKFVVQTDYMVTLDRVPDRLYTTILDNEVQLDQWREVYNTAEWDEDLTWRGEFDATFLDNHPYAMIDTGLFDEAFKLDLLSAFEDIEAVTDGVLVKGENFQALNLLLEKYRNEVDCTYIDPPYNTGKGDFAYKDHYQHSSWLSMMSDRVLITKELMKDGAPLFTTLDDNEQSNYRQLMNGIFGKTNFAGNIVWQKRISPDDRATLGAAHDNIPTYTTNIDEFGEILGRLPLTEDRKSSYTNPDDDPRGRWASVDITGQEGHATPDQFYEIETPSGVTYSPPNGRCWAMAQETFEELRDAGKIWFGEDGASRPRIKKYLSEADGRAVWTWWDNNEVGHNQEATKKLRNLFTDDQGYQTPKPIRLIERMVDLTTEPDSNQICLDFFAGSGSTAEAVLAQNREDDGSRKYILVEMAKYFDEIIRPRVQKVVFSTKWKEGIPQNRDGQSQFVKYHRLESYEDALNNITLSEPSGPQQALVEGMDEYVEGYLLDFESRESAPLLPEGTFEEPFNHELCIEQEGTSREPTPVDLVETFHYLVGADVRQYWHERHQERKYVVTECEVGTESGVETVLTAWRPTDGLDLDREAAWFDDEFESASYDRVYVNGESQITRAEPLEITFRERMEESPNVA